MTLQYQLVDDIDLAVDAQLFVIDAFDATAKQVAALHAAGRVVIAYVSAGSFEPWRSDADSFPKAAIGEVLNDYPDESWLDVRSSAVRAIMQDRLDLVRDKGFDGVLPVELGSYLQQSGFAISMAEQLDYDRFLFSEARARGLTPGLTDELELADQLDADFDWALTFDCLAADGCSALDPVLASGKPAFVIETAAQDAQLCARASSRKLDVIFKHTSCDAWRSTCP